MDVCIFNIGELMYSWYRWMFVSLALAVLNDLRLTRDYDILPAALCVVHMSTRRDGIDVIGALVGIKRLMDDIIALVSILHNI